jgi:hypothetical protein
MSAMEPEQEVLIGGETVSAREDHLKCIINLFYKINAAADSKTVGDLQWTLNYYTDVLISNILQSEARDLMRIAKEDIYQVELLKLKAESKEALTDEQRSQAKITACTVIVGEIHQYMDRYFGFEKQLAALV